MGTWTLTLLRPFLKPKRVEMALNFPDLLSTAILFKQARPKAVTLERPSLLRCKKLTNWNPFKRWPDSCHTHNNEQPSPSQLQPLVAHLVPLGARCLGWDLVPHKFHLFLVPKTARLLHLV
eukprot:10676_5